MERAQGEVPLLQLVLPAKDLLNLALGPAIVKETEADQARNDGHHEGIEKPIFPYGTVDFDSHRPPLVRLEAKS